MVGKASALTIRKKKSSNNKAFETSTKTGASMVVKEPEVYSKMENYLPLTEEFSKLSVKKEELEKVDTVANAVVVGGMKEIGLVRIDPIMVPQYLLMHPVLPRGIEIKANRIIQLPKEVVPADDSAEAKEAADMCRKVLDNSNLAGGDVFLKKMIQAAYRFGTSDSLLIPNNTETEIIKMELQHPIFFGPAVYNKDENEELAGKMKIDPKTKLPSAFVQFKKTTIAQGGFNPDYTYRVGNKTITIIPSGKEFPDERVVSLMFDTIGDEPRGIPLIQTLQKTIGYILQIEEAGAETMINFGFNKWIAETPFKTKGKMESLAAVLEKLRKGSIAVLPEGVALTNIVPGTTEFDKVHNIFLTLIAIRLGIPKPLLVMDGTSTNKATLDSQTEDMMLDFFADELIIQGTINDAFVKMCDYKYGKEGKGFDLYPKFVFENYVT